MILKFIDLVSSPIYVTLLFMQFRLRTPKNRQDFWKLQSRKQYIKNESTDHTFILYFEYFQYCDETKAAEAF